MSDWLNRIEVASPCQESWDEMTGDQRERHCDRCEQTVYDLSGMTRDEATALVARTEQGEEVCVRFRRRHDGTVLTADCPTQVRRTRSRWTQARSVAAGLFALAGGLAAGCTEGDAVVTRTMGRAAVVPPTKTADLCCEDGTGLCCAGPEVMGEMALPPEMGAPRFVPDSATVTSESECEVEKNDGEQVGRPLPEIDEDHGRMMGRVAMPRPQRKLPLAGEER